MSNPIITITMESGDVMKAELYPEIAPNTVNNFLSLVKKGYYDGLIFHRVIRGFMIATRTHDLFGALLVIGIMMQVGLQVILNIAVVTDVIPNTGIGLPFFSYGGTALFLMLCEMGVVLSVSRSCSARHETMKNEEREA